jgi:hypothetical protein
MPAGSGNAVETVMPATIVKITSLELSVVPLSPGCVTVTGMLAGCSRSPAGTTADRRFSLTNVVDRVEAVIPLARHTTRELCVKRVPSTRMLKPGLPATTAFGTSELSVGDGSCCAIAALRNPKIKEP